MRAVILSLCGIVAGAVRWAAIVMSMLMVAFLLLQIFFRYVVGQALSWSEEMALLTFAWTTLLLAGIGVYEGLHVRLTLLADLLPPALRDALDRVILVAVAGFGVYLTVAGWRYLDQTRGQVSAAVGYPIELLHAAPLVCGALIALLAVARLILGPTAASVPGARAD